MHNQGVNQNSALGYNMSYEGCDVSYVIGLDERVRLSGTIVTQIIQKKKKIGDFVFPPVPPERGVGEGVVGCMLSKSPGTPALRSLFDFDLGIVCFILYFSSGYHAVSSVRFRCLLRLV